MKHFLIFLAFLSTNFAVFAQMSKKTPLSKTQSAHTKAEQLKMPEVPLVAIPSAEKSILREHSVTIQNSVKLVRPALSKDAFTVTRDNDGNVVLIEGKATNTSRKLGLESRDKTPAHINYLQAVQPFLKIKDIPQAFAVISEEKDELGFNRLKLQQQHKGVKIYGSELILHDKGEGYEQAMGRFFETPSLENVNPSLSNDEVIQLLRADLTKKGFEIFPENALNLHQHKQSSSELVLYYPKTDEKNAHLAWHISFYANTLDRWEYFIDAQSGNVLNVYKKTCNFMSEHTHKLIDAEKKANPALVSDGAATANAADLFNTTRTLSTYLIGSTYYMIDTKRAMYSATQSKLPDDPVGVIWTLDAFNTTPAKESSFKNDHVKSTNNTWTKTAASAHYNAGACYEYYRTTFNRNSINGSGGTVISFINVAEDDGTAMDNAFWNGEAMFYGNGKDAFTAPLAKALDVAGHEISHGVVQNTADLEYEDESGALNESFADVFGAMIDRDDWKIGEDITNTRYFPTGALRDMANPNNGTTNQNSPAWQPKHTNEQYRGTEDNGGVHINSGIPNYAFYLFANNTNVGRTKAELVYYRALSQYLTKYSRFANLRVAVVKAAADLYGVGSTVEAAANSAFDAVGITTSTSGGTNTGTNTSGTTTGPLPGDLKTNPGTEYALYVDVTDTKLNIANTQGQNISVLASNGIASRPSITDDGELIIYVGKDKKLYSITIDWQKGEAAAPTVFQSETIWRNAAISRDGTKLAAVQTPADAYISVYDGNTRTWKDFQLYNPTYTQGKKTYDVQYADALEWDYSGEIVMYDAFTQSSSLGGGLEYWDINFLNVYDNANKKFLDGQVDKIFADLPEGTSVGNPTFSKNSPYIIAFDYIETQGTDTTYAILGYNLGTSDVDLIFENDDLGFPSYNKTDSKVIFDAYGDKNQLVVGVVSLEANKIKGKNDAGIFIDNAQKGVWFANGIRKLVKTEELAPDSFMKIYPNPSSQALNIEFDALQNTETKVEIFDILGKRLISQNFEATAGKNQLNLDINTLPSGNYLLKLNLGKQLIAIKKVSKI